jgi:hypothetical protein
MRALYSLIVEIIYVITLCEDLGRPITLPTIILEDNQPVIDLASDITARIKKSKHFLVLVDYVKEQVEAGIIELNKVHTSLNRADILTKIVTGNEFRKKALGILGSHPDSPQTSATVDNTNEAVEHLLAN